MKTIFKVFGETRSVVINLFRAEAQFEEPQILVAQFLAVANLFRVLWPTLITFEM